MIGSCWEQCCESFVNVWSVQWWNFHQKLSIALDIFHVVQWALDIVHNLPNLTVQNTSKLLKIFWWIFSYVNSSLELRTRTFCILFVAGLRKEMIMFSSKRNYMNAIGDSPGPALWKMHHATLPINFRVSFRAVAIQVAWFILQLNWSHAFLHEVGHLIKICNWEGHRIFSLFFVYESMTGGWLCTFVQDTTYRPWVTALAVHFDRLSSLHFQ